MAKEDTRKAIENLAETTTRDEYFTASENRMVVTPENIGGLLEYPALFHAMQENRELRPALSEAMTTGRALTDFLSMLPEEFLQTYAVVDGPTNPKTGKPYGTDTKVYAEWRASQEKIPVSTEQYNMFGKMAVAYNDHAFVKSLAEYERMRNVVLKANVCDVPCMCRIDSLYISPEGKSVTAVDIKTTSDLCTFHRAAESLYYREQQALILLILAANGFDRAQARIAAIEKGPMPRCGVFEVKDMATGPVAAVNKALQDYATDALTGKYSTRFEAPQLI